MGWQRRRVAPNEYELTANVDVEVTLAGKEREVTADNLHKSGGRVMLQTP